MANVVAPVPVKVAQDPYRQDPADVSAPPERLGAILARIGPGLVLCASIVGSGELIATTTLGAQVGYAALWVILLSCLIKPAVQAELGRYAIASGETGLAGMNRMPGPRLRKVNWVVWGWAGTAAMSLFQVGAMLGGLAQVMKQIFPAVPTYVSVLGFLALTLVLLLGGGYERIEKLAMVKVALFTMLTVLSALLLMRMPDFFSWKQFADGFKFQLPGKGLITAVAVFGITGVGTTELFMYPYWCLEKGYGRFAGPRDGSPEWRFRAIGWIRVMHLDVFASMLVYTTATLAFYLLGAGILHGKGMVPAADDMIPVLSNMYTETLGPWALYAFYLGAVATLYGTIFAATAAHSRIYPDMLRLLGVFRAEDFAVRQHYRRLFVCLLTVIPAALFLVFRSPVKMVMAGGLAAAIMLPVVGIGALFLRHRHLPREVRPSGLITFGLWIAVIVIACLTVYYLWTQLMAAVV